MISFECDYNNGAHPEVLRRLMETNDEQTGTYGFDDYTRRAQEKIRQACQCAAADVYLLGGGTQTNSVVIDALLQSFEAVIAADTAHIAVHESGAVEHCGHKIITLPDHEGRLDAKELDRWMDAFQNDVSRDHMAQPALVYISLPTELGTLYSSTELQELRETCQKYGLRLFIDGARLGYALAASGGDLTLPLVASLCDAFYIGGTKVGALCGEAVVFPQGAPKGFFSLMKQHGAIFAKGRLLGVQFDTLFTDDLYMHISEHAIRMAKRMRELFVRKGFRFYIDSPTNQLFVIVPNKEMRRLDGLVESTHWCPYDDQHYVCRFVSSWATTEADLQKLAYALITPSL